MQHVIGPGEALAARQLGCHDRPHFLCGYRAALHRARNLLFFRAIDYQHASYQFTVGAFPLDGPKTLSGLIVEHLQDIPEPNTSVKIADHPLEIVQTQDRVIKAVRVFPPQSA